MLIKHIQHQFPGPARLDRSLAPFRAMYQSCATPASLNTSSTHAQFGSIEVRVC